ncbi:STAS domain-containing protein [Flavobacterium sp.]|uniref:STAS domain-containing protein n=1 Tax=Flavobacterium sp. TaxID=239 RepID=UPI004048613B
MALQIKYNLGVFEINGSLNSQNTKSFRKHFETLIEQSRSITISLDEIKEMDNAAVNAIAYLYKKATESNKIFYIIGKQNQKVNSVFSEENLNYILK